MRRAHRTPCFTKLNPSGVASVFILPSSGPLSVLGHRGPPNDHHKFSCVECFAYIFFPIPDSSPSSSPFRTIIASAGPALDARPPSISPFCSYLPKFAKVRRCGHRKGLDCERKQIGFSVPYSCGSPVASLPGGTKKPKGWTLEKNSQRNLEKHYSVRDAWSQSFYRMGAISECQLLIKDRPSY